MNGRVVGGEESSAALARRLASSAQELRDSAKGEPRGKGGLVYRLRGAEVALLRRALQLSSKHHLALKSRERDPQIVREHEQTIAQNDALSEYLVKGEGSGDAGR